MFKIFWVWEDDNISKNPLSVKTNLKKEEDIWQIALDIVENEDSINIVAPIAWIDLEDIDLFLNKNVLTIRWKRDKPSDLYSEWVILRNSECFWGKFVRNIILPENLDFKKIKANMVNNLLVVTIPKQIFDSQNIKINKIDLK